MIFRRMAVVALSFIVASLLFVPSGNGQEFYEGRRLNIVVSYFPGGGYDIYSRLFARHLPRHIPGRPSIVVQNMPGAGSIIGANYLYRVAPRDGTVVGTFGPTQVIRQVIGLPGIAFEAEKFNWIVAAHAGDAIACVARAAAGVKTLDDAIKRPKPLIVASTAPGASTTIWPTVYREILGANFKIVSGYKGTSGIRAAMEQGEVDAGCWQWSSVKVTAEPMLADGSAVVFTQLARSFPCVIEMEVDGSGHWLNAKSIVKVLAARVRKGSRLRLAARGPRAGDAVRALRSLVENDFGEGRAHAGRG